MKAAVVLLAAVALAVVTNVIVFLIVTGPLAQPMLMCADCDLVPPVLDPMGVADPIIFSTVFGIGAVIVYAIVSSISARPLKAFAFVALLVLLLSLALPMRIPSPPVEAAAKLALMAMHVTGFLAILGTLWFGHRQGWLADRI